MPASHLLLRRARDVGRYEFPTERTDATQAAADNFERNRAALERRWPRAAMCLPDRLPELEWLYARDGALSGRHVDRQWFGECSVPARSAERMFARLQIDSPTAILLGPTHAQQIRVVLEKLSRDQALLVVIPGEFTAGVIAACHDFTDALNAGQLWLAAGPDWEVELQAILDRNEGIAPASVMIRVPGLNSDVVDAVHKPCDLLLSKHAASQKQRVELVMAKPRLPRTPARRLCVMTGAFGLWNDAASQLNDLIASAGDRLDCVRIDTANAAQRSSLYAARAAEGSDAIVTANVGRSDRAGIVPHNVPWTSWATTRVPAFEPNAPLDTLVIADEAMRPLASRAGWPADRVRVGAEPLQDLPAASGEARVSVIADLAPIVVPKPIEDMSSHRVIWDAVERDLIDDPLRVGTSAEAYLHRWCDRVGVPRASFPTSLVVDLLVTPIFIREVTRQLVTRGAPINVWGRGWETVEAVRPMCRGGIADRGQLRVALERTTAILDLWPNAVAHPARRTGRPVLSVAGAMWHELLSSIRTASKLPATPAAQSFDLAAFFADASQQAA